MGWGRGRRFLTVPSSGCINRLAHLVVVECPSVFSEDFLDPSQDAVLGDRNVEGGRVFGGTEFFEYSHEVEVFGARVVHFKMVRRNGGNGR